MTGMGGMFSFMSYWQALRWHRSHEFFLIIVFILNSVVWWFEKQWVKALYLQAHTWQLPVHIPLEGMLLIMGLVPAMQLLYVLNFVCFDVMIKRFGWWLVGLNALAALSHIGRLLWVAYHHS